MGLEWAKAAVRAPDVVPHGDQAWAFKAHAVVRTPLPLVLGVFFSPFLVKLAKFSAAAASLSADAESLPMRRLQLPVLGIAPTTLASSISFASTLMIGISAPLVGAAADLQPANRRKNIALFVFIGAVCAYCAPLLATPLISVHNAWWIGGLIFASIACTYQLSSLLVVAYLPEISKDNAERTKLSADAVRFGNISQLSLLATCTIILLFFTQNPLKDFQFKTLEKWHRFPAGEFSLSESSFEDVLSVPSPSLDGQEVSATSFRIPISAGDAIVQVFKSQDHGFLSNQILLTVNGRFQGTEEALTSVIAKISVMDQNGDVDVLESSVSRGSVLDGLFIVYVFVDKKILTDRFIAVEIECPLFDFGTKSGSVVLNSVDLVTRQTSDVFSVGFLAISALIWHFGTLTALKHLKQPGHTNKRRDEESLSGEPYRKESGPKKPVSNILLKIMPAAKQLRKSISFVTQRRRVLLFLAVVALQNAASSASQILFPVFLSEVIGMTSAEVGLVFIEAVVIGAGCAMLTYRIGVHCGTFRILNFALFLDSFALFFLPNVLLGPQSKFLVWFFSIFIVFADISCLVLIRACFSSLVPPGHEGEYFGVLYFFQWSFSWLGSLLVSIVNEFTKTISWGIISLSLLPLLAGLLLLSSTFEKNLKDHTSSSSE